MERHLSALHAELSSDLLRRLLADWSSWRRGRELPGRADFLPEALHYLLGSLILFDVFEQPRRLRYRLMGSTLVERRGFDLTGRFLESHPDDTMRPVIWESTGQAIARRRPVRYVHSLEDAFRRVVPFEALILPLSSDGAAIDMLLVGQVFED